MSIGKGFEHGARDRPRAAAQVNRSEGCSAVEWYGRNQRLYHLGVVESA